MAGSNLSPRDLPRIVEGLLKQIASRQEGRIKDIESAIEPATGKFQEFSVRR